MKTSKVLVLEDDLKTLSFILIGLHQLEERLIQQKEQDLTVTVLSDYTQVEDYLNNGPKADFDVILLDRDCKLGGSFHILDLDKFGKDKVIGISSIPEYNKQLKQKGVTKIVHKDFEHLGNFAVTVTNLIESLLLKKE